MTGGRRQGRQRKRLEQHEGLDRPGVCKVREGSGEQAILDGQHQRVDMSTRTTTANKDLLQKRLEEDLN